MIVGTGDISKVVADREGAIIFAAGVSNSQCDIESEYLREKKTIELLSGNEHACFFYFSSISIFFRTSRYTKHKIEMEELVRAKFRCHNIIRLGNIWWGDNPYTFLNYFKRKESAGDTLDFRDEWKFMIDSRELNILIRFLPLHLPNTISVFGDAMKVEAAYKHYKEWKV